MPEEPRGTIIMSDALLSLSDQDQLSVTIREQNIYFWQKYLLSWEEFNVGGVNLFNA